jgi:molybdate transport system substrate-binding protein
MNRLILPFFLLFLGACSPQSDNTVRVATAANVQYAMSDLKEAFQAKTGISVDPIIGSSGKLTAQIQNGAPYDVFVSADAIYPQSLVETGKSVGAARTYAYGLLVAWTMQDTLALTPDLSVLQSPQVKKIAVANPKLAPYGKAAEQALRELGILESISHKLVFGESISQTSQYISSRAADIGFTAQAVVLSDVAPKEGKWINLDPDLYDPIEQKAILIAPAQGEPSRAAERFYEFLFSETARSIFTKYGYLLPK